MEIKITQRDVIWNYLNYSLSICSNLFIIFIVTTLLNSQELGIWYTFLSVGGILQLIDFGFMPNLQRNITYVWSGAKKLTKNGIPIYSKNAETDWVLLEKVISSSKILYFGISLIVLLASLSFGTFYIYKVSVGIAKNYSISAWLIYSFSLFLNMYYGYWSACLRGIGHIGDDSQVKFFSEVIKISLCIIFLKLNYGLYAMVLAFLLSGLFYRNFSKFKFNHVTLIKQNIKRNKYTIEELLEVVKLILPNSIKTGLVSLGGYIITQGNTLLCSWFLGLEATSVYGLSLQLSNSIIAISRILNNTFSSEIVSLRIQNMKESLQKRISMTFVAYWSSILVLTILAILIGLPILRYFKPDNIPSNIIFIYMVFYISLEGNHSIAAGMITTKNEIPYVNSSLVSAFFVFFASCILISVFQMQLWGLLLGQSIVQLCYNNWKWPIVLMEDLDLTVYKTLRLGSTELMCYIRASITILLKSSCNQSDE